MNLNKQEKLQLLKKYLCEELKDGDVFFNAIIDTLSEKEVDNYIDANIERLLINGN